MVIKMKIAKKSYFLNRISDIRISLVVILVVLFVIGLFYVSMRYIFILIYESEKMIGRLITITISILALLTPLVLFVIKRIHRDISRVQQWRYQKNKKNSFHRLLNPTAEQDQLITDVIIKLTKNNGRILIIEGPSGVGKTTSAVLLFDKIGKTANLLNLFIKLRKHSFYFDMRSESDALIHYLSSQTNAAKALTIIDNTHKISIDVMSNVTKGILSLSHHATSIGSSNLILILCQTGTITSTMIELLESERLNYKINIDEVTSYSLNANVINNRNINTSIDEEGVLYDKISSIPEPMIVNHLTRIYMAASSTEFISQLIEFLECPASLLLRKKKMELSFIVAIGVFSAYLGYVTEYMLKNIYVNHYGYCKRRQYKKHLKSFVKNGFLEPFPLIDKAYLLSENLTRDYRKYIFRNEDGKKLYFRYVEYLYESNYFHNDNQKWLYLITCKPSVYLSVDRKVRDVLFSNCKKHLNKEYILDVLNAEIELVPEKATLLGKELGIIYIETGRWRDARDHFEQLISVDEDDIIQLKLQLIEADHGRDDTGNIKMLNTIIRTTDDDYIRFQAQYWIAHINMEHGDFSVDPWTNLQESVSSGWSERETFENLVSRITSDACRVYFLRGECDKRMFESILVFFSTYRKHDNKTKNEALESLLKAHNLHYGPIFELGIWGSYEKYTPEQGVGGIVLSRSALIERSLELYQCSIKAFNNQGSKASKTALIRKNELELCCADPNFIEILVHLDQFLEYSKTNNVNVFTAYVNCLKGKALTVYAFSEHMPQSETSQYEYHLAQALEVFKESSKIYQLYGNCYGEYRSCFLENLVELLINVCNLNNPETSLKNCLTNLKNLTDQYPLQNTINRERRIIEYFFTLSKVKIPQIIQIIKFYPIILQ